MISQSTAGFGLSAMQKSIYRREMGGGDTIISMVNVAQT